MKRKERFQQVKDKYVSQGLDGSHVDYAIEAVQEGVKREFIFENLTSEYRKVSLGDANFLLDDLYEAFGGEFKLQNRQGYIWGAVLLFIGFGLYFSLPYLKKDPGFGTRGFGRYIYFAMWGGFIAGGLKIIAAFFNKHRED